MSQSSLSYLKSEISTEEKNVYSAEKDLNHLYAYISSAMDDKVGADARNSLSKIKDRFSTSVGNGLGNLGKAVNSLDTGYCKAESLSREAEQLLSQAKSIVNGLGTI